jgi:hypothetical protein
LARSEFRAGTVGTLPVLKDIRGKIERQEIGLSELAPPGDEPFFAQFERMAHHLYENILTPDKLAALANDPIPNRHAALHGLISYRTMKTSLNALHDRIHVSDYPLSEGCLKAHVLLFSHSQRG